MRRASCAALLVLAAAVGARADFSFRDFFAADWRLNVTEVDRGSGRVLESHEAGYVLAKRGNHLVGTFFEGDPSTAARQPVVVLFDDDSGGNAGAMYLGASATPAEGENGADADVSAEFEGAGEGGGGRAAEEAVTAGEAPSVAGMRRVLAFSFDTTDAGLHVSTGQYEDEAGPGVHQMFVPAKQSFILVVAPAGEGALLRVVATHRTPDEVGWLTKYGPTLLIFGLVIGNNVLRTWLRDRNKRHQEQAAAAQHGTRRSTLPRRRGEGGEAPAGAGGSSAGGEAKKEQ